MSLKDINKLPHGIVVSEEGLFDYKNILDFKQSVKLNILDTLDFVKNLFTSEIKDGLAKSIPKYKPINSLPKKLTKVEYIDIRKFKVAIPQGMTASYLAYINVLEKNVKYAEQILENSLLPFNRWLSVNINDTKQLMSQRPPTLKALNIDFVDFKSLLNEFNTVSDLNKPAINTEFGRCFARNKDVELAMDHVQALHGNMYKYPFGAVKESVQDITKNLSIIEEVISTDYDGKLPLAMSKFISETTFSIAQQVEYYGLVVYHYIAFINAFEQCQEDIKNKI